MQYCSITSRFTKLVLVILSYSQTEREIHIFIILRQNTKKHVFSQVQCHIHNFTAIHQVAWLGGCFYHSLQLQFQFQHAKSSFILDTQTNYTRTPDMLIKMAKGNDHQELHGHHHIHVYQHRRPQIYQECCPDKIFVYNSVIKCKARLAQVWLAPTWS